MIGVQFLMMGIMIMISQTPGMGIIKAGNTCFFLRNQSIVIENHGTLVVSSFRDPSGLAPALTKKYRISLWQSGTIMGIPCIEEILNL